MRVRVLCFASLMLALGTCTTACTGNPDAEAAGSRERMALPSNPVQGAVLGLQPFQQEVISNGKLATTTHYTLRARVSGDLQQWHVQNGQVIAPGTTLGRLHNPYLMEALAQARASYDKAVLDFRDILLTRGYTLQDTATVPPDLLAMAKLRSGLTTTQSQYAQARRDVADMQIRASVGGRVADVAVQTGMQVREGDALCTVLGTQGLLVEFQILEEELSRVQPGDAVRVQALARPDTLVGEVQEVNPLLNRYGLATVRARLYESPAWAVAGMNARVVVYRPIPGQLVVPKSAVVQRQHKDVLFVYKNGMAQWVYVTVLHENRQSYAVVADAERSGTLSPGDTVIVSGNLYLAHNTPVTLLP